MGPWGLTFTQQSSTPHKDLILSLSSHARVHYPLPSREGSYRGRSASLGGVKRGREGPIARCSSPPSVHSTTARSFLCTCQGGRLIKDMRSKTCPLLVRWHPFFHPLGTHRPPFKTPTRTSSPVLARRTCVRPAQPGGESIYKHCR